MGQLANVEYFYLKCNKILGTSYTADDWQGLDNIKRPINIEWVCLASQKVYQHIHQPKLKTNSNDYGCSLKLSNRLKNKISKLAVDDVFVNEVINYLANLNKICDNDCACYKNLNCHCDCTTNCATVCTTCSGTCRSTGGACACNCRSGECNCTCPNCACECGSESECVCDCHPYDCNCIRSSTHCLYGTARPKTRNCNFNCGNCECKTTNPDDGGGDDDDRPGAIHYKYSYRTSASGSMIGTGWVGTTTVSGSVTSDVDIKSSNPTCVAIPVSITSECASAQYISVCSLNRSSVVYQLVNNSVAQQGCLVNYTHTTVDGQSSHSYGIGSNAQPTKTQV